ncbi:MAG TPA: hypothetical protein VFG52_11935 [Xanthomonadales bacterium]|nr:hypothetical protein [Xanthomonadales bacterium]
MTTRATFPGYRDGFRRHTCRLAAFACILLGLPAQALAQNCSGAYIQLNSQTAVNNFQANHGPCTVVTSFIVIEDFHTPGNEIVDLTPLAAITTVGDTMWISGTSITSLAGLENLSSVMNLSISGNINLTSLAGLGNLSSVFALGISGNPNLASLAGLENITSVQRLTIWDNPSLQSLTTWPGLASLGGLSRVKIGQNNLVNLSGLPGQVSLERLELGEANLAGLPLMLSTVERLVLTGNTISNLDGLPAVLQVNELMVEFTTGLVTLQGLPALSGLKQISITDNEALTDLGALAASALDLAVPMDTSVTVEWNFNLPSLAGLPATTRLGGLWVANNANLTSLAGPPGLQEIWGTLNVADNNKLFDCEILRTVLDDVDDGDPGPGTSMGPLDPPDTLGLLAINIENNMTFDTDLPPPRRGCDSIEEILTAESDVVFADDFEGD